MAELVKSKSYKKKQKYKHEVEDLEIKDDVECLKKILREINLEGKDSLNENKTENITESIETPVTSTPEDDFEDCVVDEVELKEDLNKTEINNLQSECSDERMKIEEYLTVDHHDVAPIYPKLNEMRIEGTMEEVMNEGVTNEEKDGVVEDEIMSLYPLMRDISFELPTIQQTQAMPKIYPLLLSEDVLPPSGLVCTPSAPLLEDEDNELGIELPRLYPEIERSEPFMLPYTEHQIKTLYYNPEMENLDEVIERFFENSTNLDHEFHRMVLAYQLELERSEDISKDLEVLQKNLEELKDLVWENKSHNDTVQGHCQDGSVVQTVISYETASINTEACTRFSELQKKMRDMLHGQFISSMFASHSSKLKIENYISNFFEENQHLSIVPNTNPLEGREHDSELDNEISDLKVMIMILFAFQRKPVHNDTFLTDTRKWLTALVSRLLLHATFEDHLFLTLHVLHCPPGITDWAVSFIQSTNLIEGNYGSENTYDWDNNEFNHNVAVLALILKPMKYRTEMLTSNECFTELDKANKQEWIVVDSEGEDDEGPNSISFHEKDILSLLNQLSFEKSLKYLFMSRDDQSSNELHFWNESNFVKMLAFARRVVDILGVAMKNYPQGKYKRLNRKLGQMIKNIVHSLCLGWMSFRRRSIPAYMSSRIQLEADTILLLSVVRILQAPSLGSWQYLSLLPFDCLSTTSVWNLLRLIHLLCWDASSVDLVEVYVSEVECREYLFEERMMNEFCEKMLKMSPVDSTFLFTTLSNVARMRGHHDFEVIEFIMKEIFMISFVNTSSRTSYSKLGRELLQSICLQHPFMMKILMKLMEKHLPCVGIAASYLLQALPLHIIQLNPSDCEMVRSWLVHYKPNEPANHLARTALNCLDWSYSWDMNIYKFHPDTRNRSYPETALGSQSDAQLFHPWRIHKFVAVSILEALNLQLLGKRTVGKLSIDAVMSFPTNFLTTNGSSHSTTRFSSLLSNQPINDDLLHFNIWSWCTCLHLKLHKLSLLTGKYFFSKRSIPSESLKHRILSQIVDEIVHVCQNPRSDDDDDGDRRSATDGLMDGRSLMSSYLSLSLTSKGYSTTEFISDGLPIILELMEAHLFIPAIQCLFNCLPIFYSNKKAVIDLLNNASFMKCMDMILKHDVIERVSFESNSRSSLIGQLMAVILIHMELFSKKAELLENVATFWFYVLTKINNWTKNRDILYLLNNITKKLFIVNLHIKVATNFFAEYLKTSNGPQSNHHHHHHQGGFLSSITNLLWSRSPEFISESQTAKEFQWFRLAMLCAERRSYEEENNLIGSLELKVYGVEHSAEFVEKSYEEACSKIGIDHTLFPLQKLSIYRLASMILEAPPTHELLPIMWYEFLGMYFIRSSRSSCGLGYNLVSYSPESRTLMKRLKERCNKCIDELKTLKNQTSADKLIPLYLVILLWMDEQRLHDPKLNLSQLPHQYAAPLFQSLINKQQHQWCGFLDHEGMSSQLDGLKELWFEHVLDKNCRPQQDHLNKLAGSLEIKDCQERLLTYFKSKPPIDPLLPPQVERVDCVFTELTSDVYLDERKLNVIIHGDLKIVCDMANMHEKKLARHHEMDEYYLDNLKKLYHNVTVESMVIVPCWSYINPAHKCKGGAVLRKRHESKQVNEIMRRKVSEMKDLITLLMKDCSKMTPLLNASRAVVRVEAIISKLIRHVAKSSKSSKDKSLADRNINLGINLFYLLVSFITPLIDHCPSAKEFTYLCIETLGKTFITNNPSQPHNLLLVISKTPELIHPLSQFFNPNSNPDEFVSLYEEKLKLLKLNKYDVVASLAAKFDISSWSKISNRASLDFLKLIVCGLSSLGGKSCNEALSLERVLRSHLQVLCLSNLPFYLTHVLNELISASESNAISPDVWDDYSSLIGFNFINNANIDLNFESTFHPDHSILITKHQIFEILERMTSFFGTQLVASREACRRSANCRRGSSPNNYPWFYCKWKVYVPHLARIFYCTNVLMVEKVHRMVSSSTAYDLKSVAADVLGMYERIQSLYHPWLSWFECFQPCWVESSSAISNYLSEINCMVASWLRSLKELHDHFECGDHFQSRVLNNLWSFFVNNLGLNEMPEFLSNIFNIHITTLPWEQFKPEIDCIENMAKVTHFPKPCFETLGNIFCAIDWKTCFPLLTSNVSMATNVHLHSIVFSILVRLADEKAILENTQLPQLLSSSGIFDWSKMLDAQIYSQSLDWFSETCDPAPIITFDLTLTSCQIIKMFKDACDFYPKEQPSTIFDDEIVMESIVHKRCSYVRFIARIVAKLSSVKNPNFDCLEIALSNLLSEVDAIIKSENDDSSRSHESKKLCLELLSLLNICPITAANIFLQVFLSWMESSVMSPLLPSMVLSACKTLANVSHISKLLEAFIALNFSLDVSATEQCGWQRVLASLEFPEFHQDEFVSECLEKEFFFTLYSFVLFKLSICQSLNDELTIMLKLNDWNTSSRPSATNESKLFLWWHKILELGLRQVLHGGSKLAVRSALVQMVPTLMGLGEDKSAAGIFGAIGLGKRSSLSLRFRIVTCALAGFITSILIQDENLQSDIENNSDTLSNMLKVTDTQTVTQFHQQTTSRLRGMSLDKNYFNYNQHIQLAIKFSQDKLLRLKDYQHILSQLVGPLFPEYYLGIIHLNTDQ